jgi:hypothetical protein
VRRKKIKGDLLHYSFETISEHIQQIDKFSEIKAVELYEKDKKSSILKVLYKPFFKFIFSYIYKMGFLDGYYGYVVCKNSAFAYFLRYAKLRSLIKQKNAK